MSAAAAAVPSRATAPGGDFQSIAFYAHKGGVGKSTIIFDVAHQLATKHDIDVIIIDADSQLNTSFKLLKRSNDGVIDPDLIAALLHQQPDQLVRVNGREVPTLLSFLGSDMKCSKKKYLLEVAGCNNRVRLLLGSPMMHKAESDVIAGIQEEASVRIQKAPLAFRNLLRDINKLFPASIILVDMSPNSNMMNQNILVSCDYFILPCNPDDNSLMSQQLLLLYLPAWYAYHRRYLSHRVRLLCVVMNRYKVGKHGVQNHTATKITQKYIDRAIEELDRFGLEPNNLPFLVPGNRFLKIQNGMGQSEVLSENHVSMFELTNAHFKQSDTGFDPAKVESICRELTLLVDLIVAQVLRQAPADAMQE